MTGISMCTKKYVVWYLLSRRFLGKLPRNCVLKLPAQNPGGHVKEENASSRGRAETTMFQVWVNALLCRATQMDLLKVESGAEERNFDFFLREDWPMIIIIIFVPHHPAYVVISYHHNNFYLWTKNLWTQSFLAWYTAVLIDGFIVHCFFEHGTKLELQKCNCSGALKKWWVQLMAMMLCGFTPLPPPKLPSGNLT